MIPIPRVGSLTYIQMAAVTYDNIIEIYKNKENGNTVLTIVCKPNYDKNQIQKFIDEFIPLGITYAIQTENI